MVGRAVLDAAGDAGNRWIFPELAGRWAWRPGTVSAGWPWPAPPYPTHAAEVGPGIDRAVASLAAHGAYIRGLRGTEQDPATYARTFIEQMLRAGGDRYRGRPATLFQLFPR